VGAVSGRLRWSATAGLLPRRHVTAAVGRGVVPTLLAFSPMTARTRSTLGPSDGRRRGAQPDDKNSGKKSRNEAGTVGRVGFAGSPGRLKLALLLSVGGAVLTFVGVQQGLIVGAPPAAFDSAPLLLVLAAAPAVLAILSVLFGRAPTGAGILVGAALLAPGLALVDAQFFVDAVETSRPEIMVPTSLAASTPAMGAYLLLAGHLVAVLAGVLAAGRAGADPDSDYFAVLDASVDTSGRGRAIGLALAASAVTVVGLLLPPFSSDDAFIVSRDLVANPPLVMYGGLVIALTVLLGAVAAASNPQPPVARGMAVGLFVGLAWLVLPQLVAIATVDWLHLERGGPLLALVPLGLLAVSFLVRGDGVPDEKAGGADEVQLETSPLHLGTGVLGVLAGVATLLASFGTLVVVEGGEQLESYANRQLLPAGIVIILLGVALFTRWAGAARPAFVVALGSVPLVGLAALDNAFSATAVNNLIPGVALPTPETRVGPAAWFVIAAIVLGAAAAIAAAIAGGAERDDVDLSKRTLHIRYGVPAGGAVLFAIGAFTSPMLKADGYTAPGILTEFRLASWGLLIGLVVVVAAAAIAALARPVRAAPLLLGAATVAGVHVLQFPMTSGRVAGAEVGSGTWLALACLVALIAAAIAAMTDPDRHAA
jgi:hypothetical protein